MQEPQEIAYERALAEAYRDGNDTALEILFQRYHTRLFRDAQRYVSREAAQDIVQDVFTALILKRTQWTIRSTVRKYLHAAVRNRARDLVARSNTERAWREASPDVPVNLQARRASAPDHDVLINELEAILAAAFAECSARVRQVLLLAEEYPLYADIGAQLGLSAGTVHTLLARGRRKIRRYLAAHGWPELVQGEYKTAHLRPNTKHARGEIVGIDTLQYSGHTIPKWHDTANNDPDQYRFLETG
jgi:RNA polymerase sigma-70 factor (ECF subfamily)